MKVTGVGDPLHGVLVPAGPWALRAHSAVDGPGARVFWVGACLPSGESFAGLGAREPRVRGLVSLLAPILPKVPGVPGGTGVCNSPGTCGRCLRKEHLFRVVLTCVQRDRNEFRMKKQRFLNLGGVWKWFPGVVRRVLHLVGCGQGARMQPLWLVSCARRVAPCSCLGAEAGLHGKERTRSRQQGGGSAELWCL